MKTAEKAAAAAYAEYCYRVYSADKTMADWKALPAYVRRAWQSTIAAALEVIGKSGSASV